MNTKDRARVINALRNEARRLERTAAKRSNAGPSLAVYRRGFRIEAASYDRLADAIRDGKVTL